MTSGTGTDAYRQIQPIRVCVGFSEVREQGRALRGEGAQPSRNVGFRLGVLVFVDTCMGEDIVCNQQLCIWTSRLAKVEQNPTRTWT